MMIIDYHPDFQQIAFVDTDSGELQERSLEHREAAEKFYRELGSRLRRSSSFPGSLQLPFTFVSVPLFVRRTTY